MTDHGATVVAIMEPNLTDLKAEFSGELPRNDLALQNRGKRYDFYFEIESNYALRQLEKLRNRWELYGHL